MDFYFGGFGIVAKDPIVAGRRPELTRLALLVAVRWVWLWKRMQPNILWRLRDSNFVLISQVSGVEDGVTGGRLDI